MYDYYGADPNSTNARAQIGRGLGRGVASVPATALGDFALPAMVAQATGGAYNAAFRAKQAELRAAGETDEAKILSAAQEAGSAEVVRQAPALVAYMVGGKLASGVVSLLPKTAAPLLKGAVSAAAGAGANATTGAAIRALQHSDHVLPNLEDFTQDAFFGALHGRAEYDSAYQAAKARAIASILREGATKPTDESNASTSRPTTAPQGSAEPAFADDAAFVFAKPSEAREADGTAEAKPISNNQAQDIVHGVFRRIGLRHVPDVRMVDSIDELPTGNRQAFEEQRQDGINTEAYHAGAGTEENPQRMVILRGDAEESARARGLTFDQRIRQLALHHVADQAGSLRALFPERDQPDYDRKINGILAHMQRNAPADLQEITAPRSPHGYRYDLSTRVDRTKAAEEYLARFSSDFQKAPGAIQRTVTWIKQALGRVVPSLKWSNGDLRDLLNTAFRAVSNFPRGRQSTRTGGMQMKARAGEGGHIFNPFAEYDGGSEDDAPYSEYEDGTNARNPFLAEYGEGPEVDAIHPTTPYRGGYARRPRHHIFPRAKEAWFAKRGVNIHDYTIQLPEADHHAIHGGGELDIGQTKRR